MGVSRMAQDYRDFCKIKQYVQSHSPFSFLFSDRLINPSSGVVACFEDGVNCDQADEIGFNIQAKWNHMYYGDISCKKADQVKTMSHMMNICSIDNDKVIIDPSTLFHRLVLVGERVHNLRDCFSYELTISYVIAQRWVDAQTR